MSTIDRSTKEKKINKFIGLFLLCLLFLFGAALLINFLIHRKDKPSPKAPALQEQKRDLCPNLPGLQEQIPAGLQKEQGGSCVALPVSIEMDVCPNISGTQQVLPDGYEKTEEGECVKVPKELPPIKNTPLNKGQKNFPPVAKKEKVDLCPNLPGLQEQIPAGLQKEQGGDCISPQKSVDFCVNLPGEQLAIPPGYYRTTEGKCIELLRGPTQQQEDRFNADCGSRLKMLECRSRCLRTDLDTWACGELYGPDRIY